MTEPIPTISGCFDIGGRALYAEWHRSPGSRVTVVVEVGSTMPGTQDRAWGIVGDTLLEHANVFFYDRANLGRSDPVAMPRPLSAFTADLRAVLQAVGAPPPYLLVGGSFGGMLATHFASLYLQEVIGVVLVDSTHPEHDLRALAVLPPKIEGEHNAVTEFRRLLWTEQHAPLETFEWEGLDTPASIQEAKQAWNLRDLPLFVLTAGIDTWEEGFPPETAAAYEAVWMDCQKIYVALSTRSRHIIVEDSDHIIHCNRPDVVINAIRGILDQEEASDLFLSPFPS
jgi:pimeloyl-ACP methyl ester carboxylesterase